MQRLYNILHTLSLVARAAAMIEPAAIDTGDPENASGSKKQPPQTWEFISKLLPLVDPLRMRENISEHLKDIATEVETELEGILTKLLDLYKGTSKEGFRPLLGKFLSDLQIPVTQEMFETMILETVKANVPIVYDITHSPPEMEVLRADEEYIFYVSSAEMRGVCEKELRAGIRIVRKQIEEEQERLYNQAMESLVDLVGVALDNKNRGLMPYTQNRFANIALRSAQFFHSWVTCGNYRVAAFVNALAKFSTGMCRQENKMCFLTLVAIAAYYRARGGDPARSRSQRILELGVSDIALRILKDILKEVRLAGLYKMYGFDCVTEAERYSEFLISNGQFRKRMDRLERFGRLRKEIGVMRRQYRSRAILFREPFRRKLF